MKNKVLLILLGAFIFYGCSNIEYITKEVKVPVHTPEKTDTIKLIDTVYNSDVYWFGDVADSLGNVVAELKINYEKKIAQLKHKAKTDTVTIATVDTVYKDKISVVEVISGFLPFWAEILFIGFGLLLLAISNKGKLAGILKNVKSI